MTNRLDYDTPHQDLYAEYCRLYKENRDLQATVHELMEAPRVQQSNPWGVGFVITVVFAFIGVGAIFKWQSHRMDDIEKNVNTGIHAKAYCPGLKSDWF